MSNKIRYYEYFVECVYNLYDNDNVNDLTNLKLNQLLFFTMCKSNCKLLNIFDNFWIMPYGHLEKDCYKKLNLKSYPIGRNHTVRHSKFDTNGLDLEYLNLIKNSVKELGRDLILRSCSYLMDIQHQYLSYKRNYKNMSHLSASIKLENSEIINDDKIYIKYDV